MHKERLKHLANMLLKNAKNKKGSRFDINAWYDSYDEDAPISCGTTACTLGFAALLPEFQVKGLTIRNLNHLRVNDMQVNRLIPQYKEHTGADAGVMFFGLARHVSEFLFSPETVNARYQHGAAGEREIAKRIKYLVRYGTKKFLNRYGEKYILKLLKAGRSWQAMDLAKSLKLNHLL